MYTWKSFQPLSEFRQRIWYRRFKEGSQIGKVPGDTPRSLFGLLNGVMKSLRFKLISGLMNYFPLAQFRLNRKNPIARF